MNTSCLIGRAKADGTYLARCLRYGDNPTDLTSMLRITHALGIDTWELAGQLLQYDWVELDPSAPGPYTPDDDPRPVPSFGYALAGSQAREPRHGHLDEAVDHRLRWLYLIDTTTDTIQAFAATRTGRWLLHSRHTLVPAHASPVLACGGYPRYGHQWQPVDLTVRDGGEPHLVAVQRCRARHLGDTQVLRIPDPVAQALAKHFEFYAAPHLPPDGKALPVIVRAGREFDRLDDDTDEPIRLPRDADGWVLLAVG